MGKVIYRLKGNLFPESFELPLRNMYHQRLLPNGQKVDKLVHYLKGAPSIWAEDYKGDKKPIKAVYFENGVLEVDESDVLLQEILSIHRFNNVKYERYDATVSAERKLLDFELREKALEVVNVSGDTKIQALALALIGKSAIDFSAKEALAELKTLAYEKPQSILDEIEKPNYEIKYLSGLAFLKGVVKENETQTAVVWADNGNVILKLAVGESGIDQLTKMLAVKSESTVTTLQRLGSLVAETKSDSVSASVDESVAKVLSEKDAQIEALQKELAVAKANEGKKEEGLQSEEELLSLRQDYFASVGKEVPPNKKNDAEWMKAKIQEAKSS